jgi:hypothetical protein
VIAGHAGTPQLKQFHMVNIKMFRHPKYYKELRKLRNKEARRVLGCLPTNELHNSDQAISHANSTRGPSDVRPGPGLKLQATSIKHQASSFRTNLFKHQATSL